ncbi:MAG TPA: hypothetical protein VJ729_12040 [Nitrososphaeraceae archaeon]|nr:hypothetical protein [Nitrososphaeraceae archaeon]
MLLSYEKIRHIVEVDEKILAVFTINSEGKTSDMFIAPDTNIDKSFIEIIRSKLEFNFEPINKTKAVIEESAKEKLRTETIGKHLWDISEYDNIRVIKIYEASHLIVVLTKPHTSLGTTADTVLGYVYECNEDEQEKREESPPSLF